jgi:hypothetical protein
VKAVLCYPAYWHEANKPVTTKACRRNLETYTAIARAVFWTLTDHSGILADAFASSGFLASLLAFPLPRERKRHLLYTIPFFVFLRRHPNERLWQPHFTADRLELDLLRGRIISDREVNVWLHATTNNFGGLKMTNDFERMLSNSARVIWLARQSICVSPPVCKETDSGEMLGSLSNRE